MAASDIFEGKIQPNGLGQYLALSTRGEGRRNCFAPHEVLLVTFLLNGLSRGLKFGTRAQCHVRGLPWVFPLPPTLHRLPSAASPWIVWGVSPGTSWFYSPANEPWDWQSGMRPWDFCPFVIWKATFRKLCYKLLQPRSELLRGLEVPRLNWPVQIQFTVQSWFERDICCCFLHPTQGAFPSEVSCSFSYNILITPSLLVCFFQHSLNWKFHIWNQLRFHECCCAS